MVPGIKKPASLPGVVTRTERDLVCAGPEKPHPFSLLTPLLVHADADHVFSAHQLTCVDKGRLHCAHASWAVTAC